MNPYEYYQISEVPLYYNPYVQPSQYEPPREPPPQSQSLERRIRELERQNDRQERDINQLQRRLQRVNQRLRAVERKFSLPYTPFEGEY